MSTSPYSIDLRERVIKYLEEGNSQRLASRTFKISKTTVNTWYVRYKNEGSYVPRKRLGSKPSIKSDDFINYMEEHKDITTLDIGKYFGLSAGGARYWLKKLGFSYKKKPLPIWKQMKKSVLNI